MGIKKSLLCITAFFIFSAVALGEKETREPNELEWCYNDIVLQTKSPELCYKISPKAVYTVIFSTDGHQIYYWRSQCFSDVVGLIGDVKLCDEVRTISTQFLNGSSISKEKCMTNVSNPDKFIPSGYSCNAELLLKTMGYDEKSITERFIKNGYADYFGFYLESLNTEDFKNRYALLPDFSKDTGDSEQVNIKKEQDNCANINDSFDRNECYTEQAIKKEDAGICKKIDAQYAQARCIAAVKKDPGICQKIPNYIEKSLCYKEVAIRKQDSSLCGDAGRNQSDCYTYFAVTDINASICNNIPEKFYQTNCYNSYYTALAVAKKDPAICNSVKEQTSDDKDSCYKNYAVETKDESVCDKIEVGVTKWLCHKELGNKDDYKNEALDNFEEKIKELMDKMKK